VSAVASLGRAVRAETVKATTTWVWWGLLLVALALVALNVGLLAALAPLDAAAAETFPFPLLGTTEGQLAVLGSGYQAGYLMAGVAGTVLAAADFRNRTIGPTLLVVPSRGAVALGKCVVATVLGVVYGVAVQALSLVLTVGVVAARGVDVAPAAELARPLLLGVAGVSVWALIGVAFGLLVRNLVVAVVVLVVVVFLLDPLLALVVAGLGEVGGVDLSAAGAYLLSNASTAVVEGFTGAELLPWWGGLLVLLAWAGVMTALAWSTTLRRDVP
jgi:ABC-2 type transport system permease protein